MTSLDGRVALVTGGAAGIGRAVVERFVADGAGVVAVDVDEDGLATLASEHDDTTVRTLACDVCDPGQVQEAVDLAVSALGGLDTVAAVAGISIFGAIGEMSHEDRNRVMDVNLFGVWNAFEAALPAILQSEHPRRLIACGSVESVLGTARLSAYVASKHAVNGLVKSLALELAELGVTVNTISPAGVETPMLRRVLTEAQRERVATTTPIPRMSSPEEVAAFFSFVAGPETGYMTGENIIVDGGVKVVNAHTFDQASPSERS